MGGTKVAYWRSLIPPSQKCGAEIRINPRDADIIIVGEDIDIRRRTVNASSNKIVLDYRWIQASVKRGAAYLEKDNWGRYRVYPEEPNGGYVLVQIAYESAKF